MTDLCTSLHICRHIPTWAKHWNGQRPADLGAVLLLASSSFVEEFCQVKLVWVMDKVIKASGTSHLEMTLAGRLHTSKGHDTCDSLDH